MRRLFRTGSLTTRTFGATTSVLVKCRDITVMQSKLLTDDQDKAVNEEIRILQGLKSSISRIDGADTEDLNLLTESISQLSQLFLVVVVGEFNAGKSTLLNALLGKRYLSEGITPTTKEITRIHYGEQFTCTPEEGGVSVAIPNLLLKDLQFVDTPGTNAIFRTHQQITEHFLPRSDLIVFVSSVDRAFSESERQFVELISQWKKKIVYVLSKLDFLDNEAQATELTQFVGENVERLVGVNPAIFCVSSKLALKSKELLQKQQPTENELAEATALWRKSRYQEFQDYMLKHLDVTQRLKLKVENPLGVAEKLLSKYRALVQNRHRLLQGDVAVVQNIKEQIAEYEKEMLQDAVHRSARIDNVLLEMCYRADNFFEEQLRLSNIVTIISSESLKRAFETQVIAQTETLLMDHISDLAEWVAQRQLSNWHRVVHHARLQAERHRDKGMIGVVSVDPKDTKQQDILRGLMDDTSKVVSTYNGAQEARQFSGQVASAIYQTAAVEVGAVGLGALLTFTMMDVTGLLGVTALAATGLCILPFQRARLKQQFHGKIDSIRKDLRAILDLHMRKSIVDHSEKLNLAIAPYSLFITKETDKLFSVEHELLQGQKDIKVLQHSWEKLMKHEVVL